MRSIEQGIVSKFGGSSNASAERVKNTAEIIMENDLRRYVVLSAPGKRFPGDDKITDLLLDIHALSQQGLPHDEAFEKVSSRFLEMGSDLHCHSSVVGWLDSVEKGIQNGNGKDWIASRGEWVMANVFARFAGGSFVDPEKLIKLQKSGEVDPLSYALIKEQLTQDTTYVIPGFYGEHNGAIKIFARGGSDITGAIIARGVQAQLYENWTDVDGVKAADPRIIPHAKTLSRLTYKEMRELGYRGADILQMDSVLPVIESGIPIHIRNSFNRQNQGTLIVPQRDISIDETVVGIAGRSGFVSLQIEKYGMNNTRGITGKILDVFDQHEISFEHNPTGLDAMSVIFHEEQLAGKEQALIEAIKTSIGPENIGLVKGIGLVCVVGEGIANNATQVHTALYNALQNAEIAVSAESYTIRGNNIVIAVDSSQTNQAIRALYDVFIQ